MASGPTQNYDDPTLVGWLPHPVLARALRVGLAVLPAAVAVLAAVLAAHLLPPDRVGLDPWLWLVLEIAASALLLVGVGRVTRRLLPLTTLLRLTLVLPDRVPSRFAALRRRSSLGDLLGRVEGSAGNGDPDAAVLLELVSALSRHDRATFRHSERVQAYATLIGRALGLGPADAGRLGWAALLHDVGKLTVPPEVLNKPGRPDPDEWAAISAHAAAGGTLAAPLARWLGPWAHAIDQHHERWDGAGYPRGLAGTQISTAARIVAVADAYDVITSARAYKAPLSPDAARAELARCAGTQFDEQVVRAFLAVGLGELRTVAGPIALLGALPALPLIRSGAQTLERAASAGSAATAAVPSVAAAMVVGAGLAVVGPVLPGTVTPATDATTVRTESPSGGGTSGEGRAGEVSGADATDGADGIEGAAQTTDGTGQAGDGTGAAVVGPGTGEPGVSDDPADAEGVLAEDVGGTGGTGTPDGGGADGAATGSAPSAGAGTSPTAAPSASPEPSSASSSGLPPTAADPARTTADGAVGPGTAPGNPARPSATPGKPNAE